MSKSINIFKLQYSQYRQNIISLSVFKMNLRLGSIIYCMSSSTIFSRVSWYLGVFALFGALLNAALLNISALLNIT